jgi:hypothetical protein
MDRCAYFSMSLEDVVEVRGNIKHNISTIGAIYFKLTKENEKMKVWREKTDSKLAKAGKSKDFLYMDVAINIFSFTKESKDTLFFICRNINEFRLFSLILKMFFLV